MKFARREHLHLSVGDGETGGPDEAAAFFNIGTILSGSVNVDCALPVDSIVVLLESGEGDLVLEVDKALQVGGSLGPPLFLEDISVWGSVLILCKPLSH